MQLNPKIDLTAARATLDAERRGSIRDILDARSIKRVAKAAGDIPRWNLVTQLAGRHMDLDAAGMADLPVTQRVEFEEQVHAVGRKGFQYLYENFPLYDKAHNGTLREEAPMLANLFDWLNGEDFLTAMRQVLDAPDIGFADAQLTCYRGGHYLTTHDDAIDGKDRVAAYILSLTEGWKPDWGGQLQFYSGDGEVEAAYVPRFNSLSLLKVPQLHAVSPVAPYATKPRLSITGWLRIGEDPGPG